MVNIFEINRLISCLYILKKDNNLAKRDYVLQRYSDEFFIEQNSLLEDVLEISLKLEFIQTSDEFLKLTSIGEDYIKLSKNTSNPSKKQLIFLEDLLTKSSFFYNEFKNHFSNFRVDYSEEIPTYRTIRRKSKEQTNSFEIFKNMNIFDSDEDGFFIPIEKNHLVSFLKNKEHLKKTNFEDINKKKTEIGEIGEKLTLDYESERLKNSEEHVQRITQISKFDDAAGFDINSFEDITSNKWDRMIEVKATTDSYPHFYLSMNEIEISSYLESQYWIYLWTDVLKEKPKLIKIQDPFKEIFLESKIKPEPTSYFINKHLIQSLNQVKSTKV